MSRIIYFSAIIVTIFATAGQGTIINVPGDYPTIQQGIQSGGNGDTVLVQPGTYAENIDFNGHDIVLASLFLTTGDTSYIPVTIIDGTESGPVITITGGGYSFAAVIGFSITNGYSGNGAGIHCSASDLAVINNYISSNQTIGFGGGAYCDSNSSAIFKKNVFDRNLAEWGGGGLYIENSQVIIMQNTIVNNGSVAFGGGILCNYYGNAHILNNTFSGNAAFYGGALCYVEYSFPVITNSIFWGDSSWASGDEIFGDSTSQPNFTYCDAQNTPLPGIGNIDIDPLFRDPDNGDFHLRSDSCGYVDNSPCIDAGDPDILDTLLNCSWGMGDLRSDMGAYGGWDPAQIGIHQTPPLPGEFALLQNYPNPFNASTTIEFNIINGRKVTLAVYDLLGREVQILVEGYRQAGVHAVNFDASSLPSGVYFYRLQAGSAVETKRMLLLK